jgi:hypothetical protein
MAKAANPALMATTDFHRAETAYLVAAQLLEVKDKTLQIFICILTK